MVKLSEGLTTKIKKMAQPSRSLERFSRLNIENIDQLHELSRNLKSKQNATAVYQYNTITINMRGQHK